MFRIHKEGRIPTILLILLLLAVNIPVAVYSDGLTFTFLFQAASLSLLVFNLHFFRKPERIAIADERTVLAPADGKVVFAGKAEEIEYFKDERIQVSIFMSVWDVHINWFPVDGEISYTKYHPGKYLVARLPKSSLENERNTVVIRMKNGREVLVRQIAGAVARRIAVYSREGQRVKQGHELGFIRYGSRVDLFLPPDTHIYVKNGDKVTGCLTRIAGFE